MPQRACIYDGRPCDRLPRGQIYQERRRAIRGYQCRIARSQFYQRRICTAGASGRHRTDHIQLPSGLLVCESRQRNRQPGRIQRADAFPHYQQHAHTAGVRRGDHHHCHGDHQAEKSQRGGVK